MKNILSKVGLTILLGSSFTACSKFDELNTAPTLANESQVQIEYFFNNALIGAQQDPHVAERAFVIYWKTAARQQFSTGIAGGTTNDGYSADYWRYASDWLNSVNTGIQIAERQKEAGTYKEYTDNLISISRIWRVYLMSELSDNFGPIPVEAFQGVNPKFNDLKEVYYFMLDELKEASAKIDEQVTIPASIQKFDNVYGFNSTKWKRYANTMRLRLAMRIAEVDAAKAKTEFEDAVNSDLLITNEADIFAVQEKGGWDALSGVMSREWNGQILSATLNNLYLGLGGIKSVDQLAANLHASIKPQNYMGMRLLDHYSTKTNDPSAGYFFDGLPYAIDPRAYKTFYIPGNTNSTEFSNYPSYSAEPNKTTSFFALSGSDTLFVDTKNTWSTFAIGDFGSKGPKNGVRTTQIGKVPGLAHKYRNSTNKRVFLANWETYFLLAEASLKGWNTKTTAQAAYEAGVKANFNYHGVSQFASTYLASESYNRVGTSAKFSHTTEPSSSYTMTYKDGYTNATASATIAYPVNTIYKNGAVRNDALTKIITQKYLANMPWLPLEAWNDHRRLGLPFFENPAVENPLPNLPSLTAANVMTNSIQNFPQRLPYPSSFREADKDEYQRAVSLLGSEDKSSSPLWWAKKN